MHGYPGCSVEHPGIGDAKRRTGAANTGSPSFVEKRVGLTDIRKLRSVMLYIFLYNVFIRGRGTRFHECSSYERLRCQYS
jgi:hypothetical protein